MIRTEKAPYTTIAISHAGMSGKNNEDRFAVSAFRRSNKDATPVLLAVLSDGIGGHRAGEIAAEIAVERISQRVSESKGDREPVEILRDAVIEVSEEIRNLAEADPDRKGMGATCAAALIVGRRLHMVTVGDSRVYLLRDHHIHRLSIDHTWIQEALDAGVITPEEVAGHPNAHIIRRYLGSPRPPAVDLRIRLDPEESDAESEANQGALLQPNDRLLLCTDGLTDVVEDTEIQAILDHQPLEHAGQSLVDLANQRGGPDNITVIGIQMPEKLAAARARPPWFFYAIGCAGLLALVALALFLAAGLGWITGSQGTPTTSIPTLETTGTPLFQPLPGEVTPLPTLNPTLPTPPTPGFERPTLTPWPTNTPGPSPTPTPTGVLL